MAGELITKEDLGNIEIFNLIERFKEIKLYGKNNLILAEKQIIKDNNDAKTAVELKGTIDSILKEIDTNYKQYVNPIEAYKKQFIAFFKDLATDWENAKKVISQKLITYQAEEERKRRELQDKLDREAREKEAKEKARLEERAKKAEESGKTDKAEELRQKAEEVFVVPVSVMPADNMIKSKNGAKTVFKSDIEITITDEKEVLRHILAGELPISTIEIKTNEIKKYVKSMQIIKMSGLIIKETTRL